MKSSPLNARIDLVLEQTLAAKRLVGAVVLVARHGEQVYHRAAGLADRESGRPMTENTLFRLASVSKPIVSAVAITLVAQQKLTLDDDIQKWLPDFRPSLPDGQPARMTIRHLLSHTAGLSYRFFEPDAQGPYARAGVSDGMDNSGISLAENLRRLSGVPLLYAPGTAWGYSLATDVLGAVLEKVCAAPLASIVKHQLTGPLAMHDTGFFTHDSSRLATPYVSDLPEPHRLCEGELVAAFDNTVGIRYSPARALDAQAFSSAGAGMVSTAGDILKMLEMLRQGGKPLLTQQLVDEMGRDQTGGAELPEAPGVGFGLGFSVLRDPQAAASPESTGTWRWGGAYGHSWFVDRHAGLSVVAFTNTLYEGMSGAFVNDLRDAVYGGKS